MSNNRLDATRRENAELRHLISLTPALREIPPRYLEYLLELRYECTTPSRVGEQLGVAVSGTSGEQHGPRTNHAAQSARRREWRELERRAVLGLGGDRAQGSTIETVIYGKDKRWRPTGASTTSQAGGVA